MSGLIESLQLREISLTGLELQTPEKPEERAGTLRINLELSHDRNAVSGGEGSEVLASAVLRIQGFSANGPEPEGDASSLEDGLLLYLRARYTLVYQVVAAGEWTEEDHRHFDNDVLAPHAWPYLRELVKDVTGRSPVTDVSLPLLHSSIVRDAPTE